MYIGWVKVNVDYTYEASIKLKIILKIKSWVLSKIEFLFPFW